MSFSDYIFEYPDYRGIALEGGGIAGIGHLGVIRDLQRKGILSELTHFAGSSVGALVAGILACRISYENMEIVFHDMNLTQFEDYSWFLLKDVYRLWKEFGWNKGNVLEKWYGQILEKYIGNSEITFQQLYQTFGSFLIITSTDIGYRRTIYYTPESAPDMPIKKAIRESMSIPFFYCPARHDNNLYLDGGILDNYPIQKLYEYLSKDKVFGVKLISTSDLSDIARSEKDVPQTITDLAKILIQMIRMQALKIHINKDDWERTIRVDVGTITAIDFNISDEQKQFLIDQGEKASQKFFDKKTIVN